MKKKCPRCQEALNFSEFNWKIKNKKRATYCKKCSRAYIKNHYENNKQYYLDKAKKRNQQTRKKKQKLVGEYLKKHPCVDCGETNILVLEFDHKDSNDKNDSISRIMTRKLAMIKLIEEIKKCEVRCSNCHRIKTEIENKSWKLKYAPVA